jgi:hypothetical protein
VILTGAIVLLVLVGVVVWRTGPVGFGPPPDDGEANLRALAALPYTNVVVESDERKQKTGVVLHNDTLAWAGVNLYCNHFEATGGVYLIDMAGEIVHRWHAPDCSAWKVVNIDERGNVYGVLEDDVAARLVKMDWNSTVLFELAGRFHHDIRFTDDGHIVTLRYVTHNIRHKRRSGPIISDDLVVISADGRIVKEVSLFDVVRKEEATQAILDKHFPMSGRKPLDILHTNTADLLERDIPGFCSAGDVLMCMRNLDLILVYDLESDEIVWKHDGRGMWQHPHEPTLLPNDNLLIFDNGSARGWSRLIELHPSTRQIVWEYKGDPPPSFFTEERGSMQRLPNGNTLVTESDTGRAFEVTLDGTVVWEWYNPLFFEGDRSIVYRMKRFHTDAVGAWMTGARPN